MSAAESGIWALPHAPAGHESAGDWWRSAVVYQIYPRSFRDSNGDGIGDLRGILSNLDHLEALGVDALWLGPVYESPQDDYGYDISNYQAIDPMYGTLSDLDELIAELHRREIRLIMDVVVNHTSDEHPWFRESRASHEGPKSDWYIWRDAREDNAGPEPNNWGSFFSGSAWQWDQSREQFYLHLFSSKQPDLNWEAPAVRAAVYDMMTWWLDRGVDGFRLDVINFISKDPDFPDGELLATGYGDGMPYFSYGPRIHEFLAEMKREVFANRPGTMTVGEMPGVTPAQARRFTHRDSGQLDMVFQFEHVDLDHGESKWDPKPATVRDLKWSLGRWQRVLGAAGWNSLYWNNHDQPRVVSRFGNDDEYWYESATALATILHMHRGTPYIYQGEELGMTNVDFDSIDDFEDIESRNHFEHATTVLGATPEEVLTSLRAKSRDNARAPMQWTGEAGAGFSSAEPWMPVNGNHTWLNAAAQRGDDDSIFAHYRRLIQLRHRNPVVVHGSFRMLQPEHPQLYAFQRTLQDSHLTVYANLSDTPCEVDLAQLTAHDSMLLSNLRDAEPDSHTLRPWEARIYFRDEADATSPDRLSERSPRIADD